MTPERMAKLVARWVRFYTRDLPTPIAQRRINEIDADLHDHIAHERAHGTSDRRIALSILSRMVRGMGADASWRGQHAKAIIEHPSSPEEAMKRRNTAYRSTVRIVLAAAFLLSLPLLAMQITDEVVWTVADFSFAGVLLVGTGLMYELATRKAANIAYRAAVGVALAAAFILIWLTGAVGIIGSEDNNANLMYGGVLAVGLVGSIIARLQSHGLALAMLATALVQVLVAVIALIGGLGATGPRWPWDVVGLTGLFAALWLLSAWLFWRAARQLPAAGAGPQG